MRGWPPFAQRSAPSVCRSSGRHCIELVFFWGGDVQDALMDEILSFAPCGHGRSDLGATVGLRRCSPGWRRDVTSGSAGDIVRRVW